MVAIWGALFVVALVGCSWFAGLVVVGVGGRWCFVVCLFMVCFDVVVSAFGLLWWWWLVTKVFLWLFVGLFGWCGYLCSPAVGGCLV